VSFTANFLDAYAISTSAPYLTHLSSRSLLPPSLFSSSTPPSNSTSTPGDTHTRSRFRGDTLLLTPSTPSHPVPHTIWATTRGAKEEDKGWVSVFELGEDGDFGRSNQDVVSVSDEEVGIERYETPTSGGKAHAIDLYAKELLPASSGTNINTDTNSDLGLGEGAVYILLTDDSDAASLPGGRGGAVRILEWDGWRQGGVREVVGWPPGEEETSGVGDIEGEDRSRAGRKNQDDDLDGKERMMGGSHAVWLD
jgi:carboxy-cis,cis-muconate cyclase